MPERAAVPSFPPPGSRLLDGVTQWLPDGRQRVVTELVVEEVPVALVYDGISHAVMLASPSDLEDFALGFSLTEGIVGSVDEVRDVEVVVGCDGIEARLTVASARLAALKERRRALAGRTGCGLCGVDSLAQALRPVRAVAAGGSVSADALDAAFAQLASMQVLHQATGAAHAAGFADWSGRLLLMREDVGRHNALDKLAGALARQRIDGARGFALITSRASHEMVHKTAACGIGLLAALAAPTALAVRTAGQASLTLIAFAGRARRLVHAHPQRITAGPPAQPDLVPAAPSGSGPQQPGDELR